MFNGVVVDPLSQSFFDLAVNPNRREEIHESLRGFFYDVRNRLSLLKIGLYISRRSGSEGQGELWDELDQSYGALEVFVDRVQTLCRPPDIEPYPANLAVWLGERRPVWTKWFEERGRSLEWYPPLTDVGGWFDPVSLIQGLDALLSSQARMGETGQPARLGWSADPTSFHLEFVEASNSKAQPLESRDSLSLSLALPLLARVMAVHHGSLSIENRDGLRVRLSWPIRSVPEATA